MQIANAGHPQPLLLRRHAAPSRIPCPASRPAGLEGPPSVTDVQLQPGETVLFITDGVTDARSPAGEHFGEERLRSEEHTSELQSLMRISYAALCLKKKQQNATDN